MATEQDKTLEALRMAMQMESDGKEYYLKASKESGNELGKKLLRSLAAEEDVHRREFEGIYHAIRSKKTWPRVGFQPDGGKSLRTIFARALKEPGTKTKAPATELDAVQIAIDKESKSYDFYRSRSQAATYSTEKEFYEILAAEEREHHLILVDYYEYLKDPAGWFVTKEHPSLDGS